MERVTIESRITGNSFDTTGTITESIQRNGRTILRVKIDDGEEGSTLEDGVLFSYPEGRIYIRYPNGDYKRFEFVNTIFDFTAYSERESPMTDAEIDTAIDKEIENIEIGKKQRFKKQLNEAVARYVRHGNDENARKVIVDNIDRIWPTLDKEITVYRGQLNAREIRTTPHSFFSTSTMDSVSTGNKFFSHEEKCCLFILHVQPGVKYFDVGELAGGMSEKEILIEGNGTFYQDKGMNVSGFRQLTVQEVKGIRDTYDYFFKTEKDLQKKIGVFEAYYFPPTRNGGRRKRRKTYKNKKNRRRQTRKRT